MRYAYCHLAGEHSGPAGTAVCRIGPLRAPPSPQEPGANASQPSSPALPMIRPATSRSHTTLATLIRTVGWHRPGALLLKYANISVPNCRMMSTIGLWLSDGARNCVMKRARHGLDRVVASRTARREWWPSLARLKDNKQYNFGLISRAARRIPTRNGTSRPGRRAEQETGPFNATNTPLFAFACTFLLLGDPPDDLLSADRSLPEQRQRLFCPLQQRLPLHKSLLVRPDQASL